MSADYDVQMHGQVTLNWSAGTDEGGGVVGYIGVPEVAGELFDSEGTTLDFQEAITLYSDDALMKGIKVAMVETLNRQVFPQVFPAMHRALRELRERQGGFQAQPYDQEAEEA